MRSVAWELAEAGRRGLRVDPDRLGREQDRCLSRLRAVERRLLEEEHIPSRPKADLIEAATGVEPPHTVWRLRKAPEPGPMLATARSLRAVKAAITRVQMLMQMNASALLTYEHAIGRSGRYSVANYAIPTLPARVQCAILPRSRDHQFVSFTLKGLEHRELWVLETAIANFQASGHCWKTAYQAAVAASYGIEYSTFGSDLGVAEAAYHDVLSRSPANAEGREGYANWALAKETHAFATEKLVAVAGRLSEAGYSLSMITHNTIAATAPPDFPAPALEGPWVRRRFGPTLAAVLRGRGMHPCWFGKAARRKFRDED
jgi:hypothetical protein